MAAVRTLDFAADRPESADEPHPRLRLRLKTIDDVKAEVARLYREGKAHQRDVGEVSKLVNVLSILGRMIEGSDLELRLAALEGKQ